MDRAVLLTLIILVLLVLLFVLTSLNKKKINGVKKKKVVESLMSLRENVNSDDESVRRDTIIKLDNILAKALQLYYHNTLSCGENLKNAKSVFRKNNYNDLWDVHKLRNKVVHDDYVVSKDELKNAFDKYKFSILKILQ